MKKTHKISNLEHIKLLSDPLKLKLLQAFAESAKTTGQVAAELGESVTKLYRHVDALHGAGLLDVVDEKRKRGTIERTFRAVAQRFEADHSLFANSDDDERATAVRDVLRVTESDILGVLAKSDSDDEEGAIIMRFRGKASPARIAELRRTLSDWLEALPGDDMDASSDAQEFGGLVAFYRVD